MQSRNIVALIIFYLSAAIASSIAQDGLGRTNIARECIQWIEKCLVDFHRIKPGMTRDEIKKQFPMDGGLHSPSTMRFTHPECHFFKIDVKFDNPAAFSSDDRAVEVSKPYIEMPIFD